MKQVIGTMTEEIDSELRVSRFGKLQLWVKLRCQNWDTNTGQNDGTVYEEWHRASRAEASEFARRYNRGEL